MESELRRKESSGRDEVTGRELVDVTGTRSQTCVGGEWRREWPGWKGRRLDGKDEAAGHVIKTRRQGR